VDFDSDLLENVRAWPFEEARKIIKRYEKTGFPDIVTFETGYGPSGLHLDGASCLSYPHQS